jgi:NADH-quinone oxidoreductase subunit L
MSFFDILWLIPVLPLAGAVTNGVFGRRMPKTVIGTIASGSVLISFLISAGAFFEMLGTLELPIQRNYFDWIQAGSFNASFGFMLDHLSGLMLLIVTGVGFLIHIYSIGYMSHEPGYYRYFAYLNLFTFAMLILVLANNYLLMFVGWEGVGLCSYLLIGFWFNKKSAADAGKKAFIVNRVGDFGFLLGTILIFWTFGSVDFQTVFRSVPPFEPLGTFGVVTAICLLLFLGATGKSAQVPLYVWLPDAMEGPTPVSALIHAATMVTAGVYMVARSAFLFDQAPGARLVVACIAALTMFIAATIALVQTDIKKVLAYSTVSQLGYMFLACGAGAYAAGMFHVLTHAFFKALLFLGAGSVIHGLNGIQDVRRMGGLRHQMPWTYRTFLIGTLAIAGIPLLSGFFSKDAVLWGVWNSPNYGKALWALGLITAGLTSFYMFRLLILTFYGSPRYSAHDTHVHESPPSMIGPLAVLAILSVFAGYLGMPAIFGMENRIEMFLGTSEPGVTGFIGTPEQVQALAEQREAGSAAEHHSATTEILLMTASTAAALAGLGAAYLFYSARPGLPAALAARGRTTYKLLVNKYYLDEIYNAVIVAPVVRSSRDFLWKFMDEFMIDGAVNGAAKLVRQSARGLRHMQSGYVRGYVGWIVLGGVLVMVWFLR